MPFEKVQPEKLAAAVVRQIEKLILRGILRPGERLPSERELSEKLGVSRPSLREAVAELKVIDELMTKMEAAHGKRNPAEEARLDADFHLAIIEASHNVIMLHMMRSMYQLLREGVFYNRQIMFKQRTTRESLLEQHQAINAALQARDAEAARVAVERHLGYVETALTADRKAERNELIARQRLEREINR